MYYWLCKTWSSIKKTFFQAIIEQFFEYFFQKHEL